MKIIVLTKNYGAGFTGATTSTYMLIENWLKMGIHVEILTTKIVGKTNENVSIERITYRNLRRLAVKRKEYLGYSDDHLGWLLRVAGIKYIHTYHGNWPSASLLSVGMFLKSIYFMPLYLMTFYFAQSIGAVSKFSLKFIKISNRRVFVARNGVNVIPTMMNENRRKNIQRRLKVLMVGNVDLRKYGDTLSVIKELNSHDRRKISISIFGKVVDNILMKELESTGIVLKKGFSNAIPYSDFDVLLSTSRAENLSIAEVEAIVSGVPVIAYDVGGTKEIVKENFTGWVYRQGDVKSMATQIMRLQNSEEYKFDNTAIVSEFSWDITANTYKHEFSGIGG